MGGPGRLLLRMGLVALFLPLHLVSLHCSCSTATAAAAQTTGAEENGSTAETTTRQPSTVAHRTAAAKAKGAGTFGVMEEDPSAADLEAEAEAAPSNILLSASPTTSTISSGTSILLTPCEIYWDSIVRVALQELRRSSQDYEESFSSRWKTALQSCYYNQNRNSNNNHHPPLMLAVTLVGYKGGNLIDQTNQDRAFVYSYGNVFLSGVLDGHGSLGHSVAEFGRHELLQRLPPRLQELQEGKDDADDNTAIQQIMQQTVIDIDRDLPEWMASAGGATASFVLRVPNHHPNDDDSALYFSNTGDSQSFLVAAILNTTTAVDSNDTQQVELLDTQIPLATQPHKPDHPAERQRLEAAGMRVESDAGYEDGARAWYTAADGGTYGLAMSRALGDRGAAGVTAQPDVRTVPSLHQLAAKLAQEYNEKQKQPEQQPLCNAQFDSNGNADGATCTTSDDTSVNSSLIQRDHIHFFVVSATDGLLDYLTPEVMGVQLAMALYERGNNINNNNKHAMTAASDLLHQSSGQWHTDNRGEYRDDMALAVVQIS